MADEEGEVVGCQQVLGNNGRVVGLALGIVWVGRLRRVAASGDGREFGGVCSYATAVVGQRWCDGRGLADGGNPVLGHVFDKGALAL